ncbi:PREDICTED: clavesin-1-like [Polistes dominula]|uniref:Clavesin-1-like n=1 Tax=Polistes dominula TaxID=743375 RepID=A0ABM1JEQ1_POLDO|nr:PREDICTED: clavesin-1-like [Polistes dominula]XP_015190940.1 PREDICTED: clavesin-1-like [Polistes dominula]XP_015190941.1 PREDICTED: clavesin-1-like [Polistes dominula]XP_015190942.1 PREDICTED: clavesin-1-like [Polistes dominula]
MGGQDDYKCTLSEETKKIAKDELREDDTIREQLLEQFRDWIKKNPLIKHCRTDSLFLLRFLRTKKFSLPIAQKLLEKYLIIRQIYPLWFQNYTIDEPIINDIIDTGYIVPLLKRDKYGRKVLLYNIERFDPYKYTSEHLIRTHALIMESLMDDEENQIRGYVYIINDTDITMGHISIFSLGDLRRLIYCIQDGLPLRNKRTYIVNLPSFGLKLLEICISYLNEKLKKRFTCHKSFEELKDEIDLKSLPKEYGGETSLQEMIDSLKKTLYEKKEQIEALNDLRIELSDTQHYINEIDGVTGSFRKLEVD